MLIRIIELLLSFIISTVMHLIVVPLEQSLLQHYSFRFPFLSKYSDSQHLIKYIVWLRHALLLVIILTSYKENSILLYYLWSSSSSIWRSLIVRFMILIIFFSNQILLSCLKLILIGFCSLLAFWFHMIAYYLTQPDK